MLLAFQWGPRPDIGCSRTSSHSLTDEARAAPRWLPAGARAAAAAAAAAKGTPAAAAAAAAAA